jgi:hypothetical protein
MAQRMRPDDAEVLNLLGLVYFKLEAYPEAEFIYRRLVSENDDVFILHSNLGLILFKQKKLADAEKHLLRAVELRPNYAKSHLYLGLLYKNRGKLGLALEHLKFAGAEKVVQEVERALMDRETTRVTLPQGPDDLRTIPGTANPPAPPAAGPKPAASSPGRPAAGTPVEPMTRPIAPSPQAPEEDPFATDHEPPEELTAPREARAAAKLQRAVDDTDVGDTRRIDLRKIEGASRIFTLHENGFLEINFSDSVRVKRGTISSYSGNLRFREEAGPPGTPAATMVRAEGQGRLIVYEKGKQTFLLDLNEEFIYVQSGHLLAVENTLSSRADPIYDSGYQNKLDTVKVFGRGSLAISTTIEPLTLRVNGDYPLSISSKAIVAWTGSLVANVVDDRDLDDLMAERDEEAFTIRFEGDGVVVSER